MMEYGRGALELYRSASRGRQRTIFPPAESPASVTVSCRSFDSVRSVLYNFSNWGMAIGAGEFGANGYDIMVIVVSGRLLSIAWKNFQ